MTGAFFYPIQFPTANPQGVVHTFSLALEDMLRLLYCNKNLKMEDRVMRKWWNW